ncbi:MAG: pyridoxal phosphate-dependent aminotransferase [Campylobacter sp.]|nr:pyridoxal phosphate-dependent aminotransferase [Campylobacter sp.]
MANFDEIFDRNGTNSVKFSKADVLPMWVADMDFKCPDAIINAVEKRLKNGIFGYSYIPDEWAKVQQDWWQKRHSHRFLTEDFIFATGVIPIISTAIRRFSAPGDKIIVQSPVYHIFFNAIKNSGREILQNKLINVGGKYEMDFEGLKACLADKRASMLILCNPHNPVGRAWSKDELAKVGELCYEHGVLVLSDEIHADLCDPNVSYTPFAAAGEFCSQNSITAVSPTKTFNCAGFQGASAIVPNPHIRQKLAAAINYDEIGEANAFSPLVAIAGYGKCGAWLDELKAYLALNKQVLRDFLQSENFGVKATFNEATYLLWLDCNEICDDSTKFCDFLLKQSKLWLNDGKIYRPDGAFLRINVATPRQRLLDGLHRLKSGALKFRQN